MTDNDNCPRLIGRKEAAAYCGITPTAFSLWVRTHIMPQVGNWTTGQAGAKVRMERGVRAMTGWVDLPVLTLAALLCTSHISTAVEIPTITAYVPLSDGGVNMVNDFEVVMAPQFLLADTGVDHRAVTLLCSRRWGGVIARVDGVFGAMNEVAITALEGGLMVEDGERTETVIVYRDPSFPLAQYEGTVSRLIDRANKHCRPEIVTEKLKNLPQSDLDYAYSTCAVVDAAGIVTEPCEVSAWDSEVKITMDVRSGEAKQVCRELVSAAQQRNWVFDRAWTIRIFSPFSGDKPIAYCKP